MSDASPQGAPGLQHDGKFVSYAQNAEDVVIWRALGHVEHGRYLDVGAAHAINDSVTRALYLRGWRGIDVEPVPALAKDLRSDRPENVVVQAAAGTEPGTVTFFEIPDTGLSTTSETEAAAAEQLGHSVAKTTVTVRTLDDILTEHSSPDADLHLLKVDVEGAEEAAIQSIGLAKWKPWLVVVEATRPNSTESTRDRFEYLLTEQGYVAQLFDGLNVFYVSSEHPELAHALSYPACPLDDYVSYQKTQLTHQKTQLTEAFDAAKAQTAEWQKISGSWQSKWAQSEAHTVEVVAEHDASDELAAAKRKQLKQRAREAERELQEIKNTRLRKTARRARSAASALKPNAQKRKPERTASDNQSQGYLVAKSASPDRSEILRARLETVLQAFELLTDQVLTLSEAIDQVAGLLFENTSERELLWLLHITFMSNYPTDDELQDLAAGMLTAGPQYVIEDLIRRGNAPPSTWAATADIELVTVPFVDVSDSVNNELHTGIQRVVREAVPRWNRTEDLQLAVFDERSLTWTTPQAAEQERLLGQNSGQATGNDTRLSQPRPILVPWRTAVVVPELVTSRARAARLTALANWSTNEIAVICYDLIPYTMPDSCADHMHSVYAHHMSVVRTSRRVSTISEVVATELKNFSVAFANQGIAAPDVHADPLPMESPVVSAEALSSQTVTVLGDSGLPLVLSVSSIEPRKNQLRTLLAAEVLWREGHEFQLLFIAGNGWKRDVFDREFARAVARGRPVRLMATASEATLWSAYRLARFSVFVSITEGFGLPAAESIAAGTPVLLSHNGAMAEVGAPGGAEFVNPHDLSSITEGMRRLLTDDEYLLVLKKQATQRALPTWDDYARETWAWLAHGKHK